MASKIQRLVGQARATFRKVGEEPAFSDEMKKLKEVVSVIGNLVIAISGT
jgi:hypothetical protein